MELGKNFYSSQLEAIQKFYSVLLEEGQRKISMTEAIISWFTEGHAEAFREEYLKSQTAMV